jgi:cell division protein FtsQ
VPRQKKTPARLVVGLLKDNVRTITGLVLIMMLVSIVTLAKYGLSDPYRFPLEVVEVKGDFRYLDKQELQGVYKASVKRVWPATLRIQIEEQLAVAQWGEQGYLNKKGEPFFPTQLNPVLKLPVLAGPEGHELKVLENYHRVTKTLAPLGITVAGVELDSRRAWHLQVSEGVLLELGRTDTRKRLQRFINAYPAVFAGRIEHLKRVDLRYSNGFSVDWQQLALKPDTDIQS